MGGKPLPPAEIELIRKWIAGGALENAGSKATIVNKPTVDFTLPKVVKGKPDGPPPMPPRSLRLEPVVRTARANAITAIASRPWAPLLAVAGQKQVLLYHSDTLELLGVLPFPEGVAHVLKFSRNGSLLVEAEVSPADLAAARTQWRRNTWAAVLSVLGLTLLLCAGPIVDSRQRAADARQRHQRPDADLAQLFRIADAGQHQKLRRIDHAAGQHVQGLAERDRTGRAHGG